MSHRLFTLFVLAPLALAGLGPLDALADPPGTSPVAEARVHFRRGVALYRESDYRGALVEFKRAYEIAPNAVVLYNIGETYYQLQNYAAALTMLERYLVEAGATAPHRRDVEQTVEVLRTRVGKVRITTNVPGCEITIDDELIGRTPLGAPTVVSVGRRKITAIYPGRSADTRFIEVPAGDVVPISLSVVEPSSAAAGTPAAEHISGSNDYVTAGWITTGALGVGALTAGVVAYVAARRLDEQRATFPTTRDDLDRNASRAKTIAVVADVLGVAAVVAGAVTLKLTLSRSRSHEVQVAVTPNGIELAGVFQ